MSEDEATELEEGVTELTTFYHTVLGLLIVLCSVLCFDEARSKCTNASHEGRKLEMVFVGTFMLCAAADWLQGPYVYALYASYGFEKFALASLFVTGFASAGLLGPLVGQFADKFGRKRSCMLLYCGAYALSCMTKHFNIYAMLFIGRILGGIATSVLYSSFESWLVCEHARQKLPPKVLDTIFSNMYFGNGLCAIVMGIIAELVADAAEMRAVGDSKFNVGGDLSPFDLAILFLILGATVMALTWVENTESGPLLGRDCGVKVAHALKVLSDDPVLLLLMVVSSVFEAAMYAFIFEWTPALSHAGRSPPLGLIFACFMLAYMAGANLYPRLSSRKIEGTDALPVVMAVAAFALGTTWIMHLARVAHYDSGTAVTFLAFLLFEGSIGLYMPTLAALKARHVPEDVRATLYTLFRVPLNAIVCAVLLATLSLKLTLMLCTMLLLTGFCCSIALRSRVRGKDAAQVQPAAPSKEPSKGKADTEASSLLKNGEAAQGGGGGCCVQ